MLIAPDFVAGHLAAHAGHGGHGDGGPRVAVGYRSRAFDFHRAQPSWDDIVRAEADDRVSELGPDGHGIGAHVTPWFFVYSCNFSITRGEATPRFDEAFVGWGMEDIEFGYRLHRKGYQVVAAPRARVLHIEDPRPRDPFRCEVRQIRAGVRQLRAQLGLLHGQVPDDAALAGLIRTDMRWFVPRREPAAAG